MLRLVHFWGLIFRMGPWTFPLCQNMLGGALLDRFKLGFAMGLQIPVELLASGTTLKKLGLRAANGSRVPGKDGITRTTLKALLWLQIIADSTYSALTEQESWFFHDFCAHNPNEQWLMHLPPGIPVTLQGSSKVRLCLPDGRRKLAEILWATRVMAKMLGSWKGPSGDMWSDFRFCWGPERLAWRVVAPRRLLNRMGRMV